MPPPTPKEVIANYLCNPPEPASPVATLLRRVRRHDYDPTWGFGATPNTVLFLKERAMPRRQVHAVRFEIAHDIRVQVIVALAQDAAGHWQIEKIAGGGGRRPAHVFPWVNLVGSGWPGTFFAGGHVFDLQRSVATVRVVTANDIVLEDTPRERLVLFLTACRVERPFRAELYDRTGQMLTHHPVLV